MGYEVSELENWGVSQAERDAVEGMNLVICPAADLRWGTNNCLVCPMADMRWAINSLFRSCLHHIDGTLAVAVCCQEWGPLGQCSWATRSRWKGRGTLEPAKPALEALW